MDLNVIYFFFPQTVAILSLVVLWFAIEKRKVSKDDWHDYVIVSACVILFVSQVAFWVLMWPQYHYVLK